MVRSLSPQVAADLRSPLVLVKRLRLSIRKLGVVGPLHVVIELPERLSRLEMGMHASKRRPTKWVASL